MSLENLYIYGNLYAMVIKFNNHGKGTHGIHKIFLPYGVVMFCFKTRPTAVHAYS